ncbi:MAG: hypothetical protein ACJAYJ_002534 [Saprospiraceae bacterium]|jgi:hypothetical protein
MIHLNNKVAASAVYSIEDYNHEIANKRRTSNSDNMLLGGIILFAFCGLYLTLMGA